MTGYGHCPNCGVARPAGAAFCVSCGFALPAEMPAPPPASPVPPPAVQPDADTGVAAAPAVPAAPATARLFGGHSFVQLATLVVGTSLGVAAVAVALTLALAPQVAGSDGASGAGGELQVIEVANIRAEVPKAWAVVRRGADTIAVHDQARRVLWLRSARLPSAISLDRIQEEALKHARSGSPDAKVCAGPDNAPVPGGPAEGRYFVICYTFVPQGGGPAVPLADAFYVATGAERATFMMQLTAVPEALEAFAATVRQLPAPAWKLHGS